MKKNFIIVFGIMLFACAMLTGCKKESTQSISATEINDLQVGNNSSCKLTHNVWGYYFTWDFHYNDKGLADEWKVDQGYRVDRFKLEYDKFNKLIKADDYDDFNNIIFTNSFTYSGNRLIEQKWANLPGGPNGDILYFHNSKGQIEKEDDIINDVDIFMTYDNMGNCTRHDYYIGSDLFFSDIYEFNSHVRNPLLTVSGVDLMFPYSGAVYFDKLWFTRNLSILYFSDGSSLVINDLNASKTDFSTGPQDFPISVNYYDTVSASPSDFTFGYSCNGNSKDANQDSPQNNSSLGANKTTRHAGPMLLIGAGKSIKKQLQELRKQYEK